MTGKKVSAQQIVGHNTPEDCWIVVDKQVWDVTDFLDEHPGGSTSETAPRKNSCIGVRKASANPRVSIHSSYSEIRWS